MRIRIVAVGKLKESYWRDAVGDYVERLRRYVDVSEVELRDESESEVAHAMRKALSSKWHVVLLTIGGRARSSEELAAFLEQAAMHGRDLAFVLGGADGVPAEIIAEHKETLSLSRMTMPHRLARLVLVEQLYRAMTIRKGEPYHH